MSRFLTLKTKQKTDRSWQRVVLMKSKSYVTNLLIGI